MGAKTSPPDSLPPCPRCGEAHVGRNETFRSGSPQFLCRRGGRRVVADPTKVSVPDERKDLLRRLLLEASSLRVIATVTGVSGGWLQNFVDSLHCEETLWELGPLKKRRAG